MEQPSTTDETNDSRRVTIVLSADDAARLDEIATKKRTTISGVVREILGAELDRLFANA